MIDFPLPESAYLDHYRPLKERAPVMQGWDVFAVQTGLLACGKLLPAYGPDGFYGDESADAAGSFQKERGLWVDRIAGGDTMREIAKVQASKVSEAHNLIAGLAKGQFERESSLLPPNYSARRQDATRSRDLGLVQLNDRFASRQDAFDVRVCVAKYGRHVRAYYEKYREQGLGRRRAWELAAGSWNAPSWTDRLAKGETLLAPQQAHIDEYIETVTALIRW